MKKNARTAILPQINSQTRVLFALFSVLLALPFSQPAQAQTTLSWRSEAGNGNWSDANNWWNGSGPQSPAGSEILQFDNTAQLTMNNNLSGGATNRHRILFNSGTGSRTITGSTDNTFFDFSGNGPKIENTSANAQTLSFPMAIGYSFMEINPVNADLTIGANLSLGANQLRVYGNNAKTLTFTSGSVISGTLDTLSLNQNSTVVFNSAHTYTGDTFINAGTLQLNSGGSAAGSTIRLGNTSGTDPATLAVASGGDANSTIVVRSGSSGVKTINTTAASGTATVSGSVYLDADVTINSTNGGTLSFTGTEFDLKNQTATVTVSNASSVSASTVFKNSTGSGKLTKSGAGTLTLSGANTYTGETKIQKGIVVASGGNDRLPVGTAVSLGLASSTDTGVLQLGDSGGAFNQTLASLVRLGTGGTANAVVGGNSSISTLTINNSGSVTFDGLLGGTGLNQNSLALTKTAAGTLTLTAANTYSGATAIQNGTVVLQTGDNRLPATTAVTLGSGTTSGVLQLGNSVTARSQSLTSLTTSGTGTGNRVVGAHVSNNSTLTLNNSSDVTYDGFLGGPGSNQDRLALTKSGAGTLTLTAANTFSGGVNLSAGQLNINNAGSGGTSSAIGTGTLTISGGIMDNTSAGALVISTANPVTLGNNFTFGGTQNLTFGSGTVALTFPGGTPTRTITLNGTSKTLTFGGGADMASLANNTTFEVNGAGNTLVLGALDLNADANARNNTWSGSANVTINGAVTPGGAPANRLLYTGSGTMTLNGNNTYNGLTTMDNAAGTLTLNGANTGSGGVTLTTGRLNINNAGSGGTSSAIGTGTLTLTAGTIDNTSGSAIALSTANAVALNGNFTFGGSSDLSFASGTSTMGSSRTLTLNGTSKTLTLGSLTVSGTTANLTVNEAGSGNKLVLGGLVLAENNQTRTRTLDGSGNVEITGAVTDGTGTGADGLTKSGAGTLTLSGANTYTGATTVNDGPVRLGANEVIPNASAVTITKGVLDINGRTETINTLALGASSTSVAGNTASVSDIASGGLLTLGGSVTYNAGTAGFLNGQASISANLNLGGNRFVIVGDGSAAEDLVISSLITGTGFLSKGGAGTLKLSNPGNAYPGITYIDSGTIKLGASQVLPNNTVTVKRATSAGNTSGVLDLNGYNETIGALDLGESGNDLNTPAQTPSVISSSGPATLTLGGNITYNAGSASQNGQATISVNLATGTTGNRNITVGNGSAAEDLLISGAISGGAITKLGAGTLTLSGVNTYSGATTVSLGTLALSGSGSLASPAITVAGGATFSVSGLSTPPFALGASQSFANSGVTTANIAGNVSAGSGTVALSYGAGTPSFTTSGTLTLASSTTFTVNNTGAQLGHGNHKLIAKSGAGAVTGLPSTYSITGGGAATPNSLRIVGDELNLTVNNAPVAQNLSFSVAQGDSGSLTVIGGKHPPTDADSDPLTVTAVGAVSPVAAGTAGFTSSDVTFTAASDYNGTATFSYTVSDGYGGSDTKMVTVTITPATSGANLQPPVFNSPGEATLNGFGIPGRTYQLQYTTSLNPVNWQDVTGPLATAAASVSNGTLSLVDTNAGGPSRYYRTR